MSRYLKILFVTIFFNKFNINTFCMEKINNKNDFLSKKIEKINRNIKLEEAKEKEKYKLVEKKLQEYESLVCKAFGIINDKKNRNILFKCKLGVRVDKNQNNIPNVYDIMNLTENKSYDGYPLYVFEYSKIGEEFDKLDVYFYFISEKCNFNIQNNLITIVNDVKNINTIFENIKIIKILKFKKATNLYEDKYNIYNTVIEYGEKLKKNNLDFTCGWAYYLLEHYIVKQNK